MGQVFGLSYILVWELLFCLLDLCGFKQKNIDIFILCFCFLSAVITCEIKEYFYVTAQKHGSQNMDFPTGSCKGSVRWSNAQV